MNALDRFYTRWLGLKREPEPPALSPGELAAAFKVSALEVLEAALIEQPQYWQCEGTRLSLEGATLDFAMGCVSLSIVGTPIGLDGEWGKRLRQAWHIRKIVDERVALNSLVNRLRPPEGNAP